MNEQTVNEIAETLAITGDDARHMDELDDTLARAIRYRQDREAEASDATDVLVALRASLQDHAARHGLRY